jgi:hypothetical protein
MVHVAGMSIFMSPMFRMGGRVHLMLWMGGLRVMLLHGRIMMSLFHICLSLGLRLIVMLVLRMGIHFSIPNKEGKPKACLL